MILPLPENTSGTHFIPVPIFYPVTRRATRAVSPGPTPHSILVRPPLPPQDKIIPSRGAFIPLTISIAGHFRGTRGRGERLAQITLIQNVD